MLLSKEFVFFIAFYICRLRKRFYWYIKLCVRNTCFFLCKMVIRHHFACLIDGLDHFYIKIISRSAERRKMEKTHRLNTIKIKLNGNQFVYLCVDKM